MYYVAYGIVFATSQAATEVALTLYKKVRNNRRYDRNQRTADRPSFNFAPLFGA